MSKLSVVVPVYNEEKVLHVLYTRLSRVTESEPGMGWEFIFVDDASTDRSVEILKGLAATDNRVRVIRFSRNFGSHQAIMAGLSYASGDLAVNLSADLQDPPEVIPAMVRALKEHGAEIVWAVREAREDPWSKVLFARLFYLLMRAIALKDTPPTGADIVLMTRKVLETIVGMRDKNISLFSLILWSGFTQTSVPYRRERRQEGSSKWTASKRIKMVIDSVVSFSYFPIRFISGSGIVISTIGFAYAAYVVFNTLVLQTTAPGYASLMVVILVLSGFQLLMLGIVAEYLWRALSEIQHRPSFIIAERIGFADDSPQ